MLQMNVWPRWPNERRVSSRYFLTLLLLGGTGDLCLSLTRTYHECPQVFQNLRRFSPVNSDAERIAFGCPQHRIDLREYTETATY